MLIIDRSSHRETAKERERFAKARKAERQYAIQLRKVARNIGHLVDSFPALDQVSLDELDKALRRYSHMLEPWARVAAQRMLTDVSRRDERAWHEAAKQMGRSLRNEIETAPTGRLLMQRLEDQVHLITSLPLDAAQRVHKLTREAIISGRRASDIADEIKRTGDVTQSRANLIARTEVARTASELTSARAQSIGSEGYIWRTSRDEAVRQSHREMEGKFVRWDDPPTLSDGTTTHAGQIYNCRCYPEPVIPDELLH